MKSIQEMSKQELVTEIKYIVSLADDAEQFEHQSAYLAELTDEFAKRVWQE